MGTHAHNDVVSYSPYWRWTPEALAAAILQEKTIIQEKTGRLDAIETELNARHERIASMQAALDKRRSDEAKLAALTGISIGDMVIDTSHKGWEITNIIIVNLDEDCVHYMGRAVNKKGMLSARPTNEVLISKHLGFLKRFPG